MSPGRAVEDCSEPRDSPGLQVGGCSALGESLGREDCFELGGSPGLGVGDCSAHGDSPGSLLHPQSCTENAHWGSRLDLGRNNYRNVTIVRSMGDRRAWGWRIILRLGIRRGSLYVLDWPRSIAPGAFCTTGPAFSTAVAILHWQ